LYLKAWTDGANLAEVHAVKPPVGAPPGIKLRPRRIGVKGIAVREYFYARERPSGELFHDIEWSLGQAEDAVAPLLNELRGRWPLAEEEKAAVAEFIALQTVRVPKEFERLNQVSEAAVEEFVARTDHTPGPGVIDGRLTEEAVTAHYKFARDKTRQMKRMLRHERIGAAMIGSMQWALVEFDEPLLVTSDHPVHLWPLEKTTLRPRTSETPGVRDTLELKWPLSPDVALLGTWRDVGDACEPLKGTPQLASSLNSLLITQADEQWLHVPGTSPPYRGPADTVNPWSVRLFPEYSAKRAARSMRLRRAIELVEPMLVQEDPAATFSIVYIPPGS
jgi:hypothetical protein